MRQINNKVAHSLGAGLMGGLVLLSLSLLFSNFAEAQGAYGFGQGRYSPYPDTTFWRILLVVCSGAAGYAIGWFCSPAARQLRLILLAVMAALVGLIVLVNNGAIGWTLAFVLAWGAFAAGIGYWVRGFAKRLAEVPTSFGSASWAKAQEIKECGLINQGGFRIGYFSDGQNTHNLHYNGDRHLLTFAPSRAWKGVAVIISNLLAYLGSVLVIDPKGENAMVTAGYRKAMGQEVHVIDPFGITGMASSRFNPMDWIIAAGLEMVENAFMLADAIIVAMGGDQFWTEEAKAYLLGMLVYVATDPAEDGQRHLGRVRDLLMLGGNDLNALYKHMLTSPHHIVRTMGARCLQKDEKLLSNVIASVQAQTHFLDSPYLRENLKQSDFDFADLKSKAMTIYLVLPSDRLNVHGRWLRVLIQQALTVNARNIEIKPEKPVLFLLDEMAALGELSMVKQAFGLMAGYGIQLWGILQDASQLKTIYGDGWESFISNAGMIQYFGSRDRMTAEYFSKLCGVTTIWNMSTAIARAFGQNSGGSGGGSTSTTTTTTDTANGTQRQLAYPDELMRLPKNRQLLLIENMNPILAGKTPWFKDPHLKDKGVNLYAENTAQTKPSNTASTEA